MAELKSIFDRTSVPYCLGGSWASSLYGTPRLTLDVDFIVVLEAEQIGVLASAVRKQQYYVSESAMREGVEFRRSFNIIAGDLGLKADCFVRGTSAFDLAEFDRRRDRELSASPRLVLPVKSPEDTVLRKLLWHQAAGGSEVQWRDVIGVLLTRGAELDFAYLESWADQLGLRELLDRASHEARG